MKISRTKNDTIWITIVIIFAICFLVSLFSQNSYKEVTKPTLTYTDVVITPSPIISYTMDSIPKYTDDMEHPYVYIDNNIPDFSDVTATMDLSEPFEIYSKLDDVGRCGVAIANVCKATMPASGEKDTKSSKIDPVGWPSDEESDEAESINYNRCHLIAFSLTAESGNEQNLITGTRYMNVSGMYPFEYQVKKFINEHYDKGENPYVLYRVTPIFEGKNLLASGVHMEAMSHGISGNSLQFNVFVYNVQRGIKIDYSTGKIVEQN